MTTTLLDTQGEPDALEAGFSASIHPTDGGLRIEYDHSMVGPVVTMWSCDGQVELIGRSAIVAVVSRLNRALALSERAPSAPARKLPTEADIEADIEAALAARQMGSAA